MILIYSCNKKIEVYKSQINSEISNITTVEDQKETLQKVYDNSQQIVDEITNLEKNILINRKAIYAMRAKKDSLAISNMYRVEKYLEKFPYPTSDNFNEEETLSIYYAIINDFRKSERIKYFETLNDAYKNGSITKYNYYNYLDGIHYLVLGSFYKYDKNNSIEKMIENMYPIVAKAIDTSN
ncbi:hypothetical protein [Urechidicola croceus]|nr:hypothetical protein [Urechidicola croceus]